MLPRTVSRDMWLRRFHGVPLWFFVTRCRGGLPLRHRVSLSFSCDRVPFRHWSPVGEGEHFVSGSVVRVRDVVHGTNRRLPRGLP